MGLLKRHCGELAGLLQDCRCGDGKGWLARCQKRENSMKNWLDGLKDESHITIRCIGEGNGNPLQCSCLENPGTAEPGGLPSMGSHRDRHD